MEKAAKTIILGGLSCLLAAPLSAQDKAEAAVGGDLVSSYVWRGQDLGGVSIQPSASVSWKGLSLTAWGSVGFDRDDTKELDWTLGYACKGFSVSVTDYWFDKSANFKTGFGLSRNYFHYGSAETSHVWEAQIGYDFGFMALNWYTNIGGNDGRKDNGDRAYSSYFSIGAPFKWVGLDWKAEVGATPWATSFYNGGAGGFEVSCVSLKAEKSIPLTEKFSLPLSVQAVCNPATEDFYIVLGLHL